VSSEVNDALRDVMADERVGGLINALDEVSKRYGRLPGPAMRLALAAHECLRVLGQDGSGLAYRADEVWGRRDG
jgi:hypothetical protein